MSQTKELVLGYMPYGGLTDISPFSSIFSKGIDVSKQGLDGCDALLLWGGEDVHPRYYGENLSMYCDALKENSRDEAEWRAMKWAKTMGIPIIGVCRGAQFLCAFAGGKIVQDITGHTGSKHGVDCTNFRRGKDTMHTECVSAHHQMMYPFDIPHELLAITSMNRSHHYYGDVYSYKDIVCEPEIVYFPTVKGIGIQSHPEWMSANSPFVGFCLEVISDYLLKEETETA